MFGFYQRAQDDICVYPGHSRPEGISKIVVNELLLMALDADIHERKRV